MNFATILLLVFVGSCQSSEYLTFNQYLFSQEQKTLEKDLRELERKTFINNYVSLGSDYERSDWLPRYYNVSKVATTLIRDLQPTLTPSEAKKIGNANDWVAVSLPSEVDKNDWYFDFHWRYPVMFENHLEPVTVKNWRKLTNRAVLWKFRQTVLFRGLTRTDLTEMQVTQELLNNLLTFLEIKVDLLRTRSFEFSLDQFWLQTVANISLECHRFFNVQTLLLPNSTVNVFFIVWDTVDPNLELNTKFWSSKLILRPEITALSFQNGWDEILKSRARIILDDWVKVANEIVHWKFQSVLTRKNFEKKRNPGL